MNIFFVSLDPYEAAQQLCDKHVVKMIIESAQMLSTAHRVLDGIELTTSIITKSGSKRKKTVYKIQDERDNFLYGATHINHPSNVWCRTSVENYYWLYDHLDGLIEEYIHRYDKLHKTSDLLTHLKSPPYNITSYDMTPAPSCMPDECKIGSLVENYRNYYNTKKRHIHSWKNRAIPHWIK